VHGEGVHRCRPFAIHTRADVASARTSSRIPARRHVRTESELSDAGPLPAEAAAGEGAEVAAAV